MPGSPILVALTFIGLFGPSFSAFAQYSGPVNPPQVGQYPQISQPSGQAASEPADDVSVDPTVGSDPEEDAAADQKHGVARISIVQGDVNIRRGDNGQLVGAALNAPLTAKDRLQTSAGSRAEVQFDSSNIIRLGENSDVGLAELEYRRYQIQLGAGTMVFRVLRASGVQVEVDTPSIGFRPLGEGEFRLSVLDDGSSQITSHSGEAEIFGPRGSERLTAGQTVLVRGNPADPEFRNMYAANRDELDDWSAHRDSDLLRSRSAQYVSADIAGAADLDQYGNWVPSQYGQVWAPQNQGTDWSPYSSGQWSWQDYYGWSWVDSAPWGWGPYHYGRWFHNAGYGWCWWPGSIHSSSFWRPALVGFFGWGGFGVSVRFGGLGWCPLAPFETFHRWWGPGWQNRGWAGYGYGGRGFRPYGSFTRNVDIARVYRNAAFRGGAMTARYDNFGGPHQRFAAATRGQLSNANSFRGGQVPISPTRTSYQFSSRNAVANPRLAGVAGRQFYESSRFGAGQPRSAGLRPGQTTGTGNGQSGFAGNAQARGQETGAANRVAPNMQSGYNGRASISGRSGSSGWQRFGDPGRGGALRQGVVGSGVEQGGWHSFGQPGGNRQSFGAAGRYAAPSSSPRPYGAPNYGGQQRYSVPSYGSTQRYSAPTYGGQQRPGTQSYGGPQQLYRPPSYGGGQRYSSPNYAGGQRFGSSTSGNNRGSGSSFGGSHVGGSPAGGHGSSGSSHSGGGHHR